MRGWFVIPVTGWEVGREFFACVSFAFFACKTRGDILRDYATHSVCIYSALSNLAHHRNRYTMRIQQRKLNIYKNSVLFTLHICIWIGKRTHCNKKNQRCRKWFYLYGFIETLLEACIYICFSRSIDCKLKRSAFKLQNWF